jgi:superfamily II DNA or RNA helicase
MIELSERLLADAGGWQALKEARSLYEMDRVAEATWEPPLLQGRVRAGETEFRAGLRVLSKSNIENLCTCRDARQRGLICAHSLAVGLAVLKPRPAAKPTVAEGAITPQPAGSPLLFADQGEPLELAIVLVPNLAAAWEKDAITVGVEAITGGRRILLSAVDARKAYRTSEMDRRLIEQFVAANGGALPGMLMLPRLIFVVLLAALAGHPRVTFGKTTVVTIVGKAVPRPASLPPSAILLSEGHDAWLLEGATLTPLLPEHHPSAGPEIDRHVLAPIGDAPEFFLKLEGSLNHLAAELESSAGSRHTTIGSPGTRAAHPAEQAAIERLLDAGFLPPNRDSTFILKGEPKILAFFAMELPRLQRIWKVTIGARFEHVTRDLERVTPRFEVRGSGENWFDLSVELATPSGERFSAAEIQRLLQSGQRSLRLKNQKVAIFDTALLDEFQDVLRDCEPAQRQPGSYRVDQRHAAYLADFAREQGISVTAPPAWKTALSNLAIDRIPSIPLGDLETVLRPYQKEGVYWLNSLAQRGFAGLLADEMGLGKTIQMLSFLRTFRRKALVVCPSSLIFNWLREAERFAPDLKALAIIGPNRADLLRETADLYLTSYPLLRRDVSLYRGTNFETVILDEAQHIKNPDSQNAQAAVALRARYRFALTGTPVENSVRDLWSLMNFLMPGYLGTREDFRDRFEKEIETDPTGSAQRRLRQRLRPFILRRTKREVIKELPDKIEQVAYCELSESQSELYTQLSKATREQLSELAGSKDRNRARMTMLTALLRLRQTCCDVRLLRPDNDAPGELSGKIEMLEELLAEAIDGGHRVLVFSQFATMLRLLAARLQEIDVSFCHLDGQTKNRAAEVDRFQAGEVSVFLVSLKAGGTGLNLTAADTVIHFDPWWNPAIEAQATDRAHRIGQKSVVTSYKLIARNTVEEKILALQQKKRAVIAASLESEEPLMDSLSMDDLAELLS